MDPVDLVGLSLSVVGIALSIISLVKADGAAKAVERVIVKNSDQIALENARSLLEKLKTARDAAIGRKQGASEISALGRTIEEDKRKLELAQDALATVAFGTNEKLVANMRLAAKGLKSAQADITRNSRKDGWAAALGTLQGVIPELELWQQELGVKNLR